MLGFYFGVFTRVFYDGGKSDIELPSCVGNGFRVSIGRLRMETLFLEFASL